MAAPCEDQNPELFLDLTKFDGFKLNHELEQYMVQPQIIVKSIPPVIPLGYHQFERPIQKLINKIKSDQEQLQ